MSGLAIRKFGNSWTVGGWYPDCDGGPMWEPIQDCNSEAEACLWLSFLNGGQHPDYVTYMLSLVGPNAADRKERVAQLEGEVNRQRAQLRSLARELTPIITQYRLFVESFPRDGVLPSGWQEHQTAGELLKLLAQWL